MIKNKKKFPTSLYIGLSVIIFVSVYCFYSVNRDIYKDNSKIKTKILSCDSLSIDSLKEEMRNIYVDRIDSLNKVIHYKDTLLQRRQSISDSIRKNDRRLTDSLRYKVECLRNKVRQSNASDKDTLD